MKNLKNFKKFNEGINQDRVPTEREVLDLIFREVHIRGIELEAYEANFRALYEPLLAIFEGGRTPTEREVLDLIFREVHIRGIDLEGYESNFSNLYEPLVELLSLHHHQTNTKMSNQTIHLQSIGKVPAIPAGELKPGDILMWNFGSKYSVDSIIKETPKTIVIGTTDLKSGKSYEQRLLKSRLVAKVGNLN